jgi:MoaA/NifB/PqqE/SkfB family radical SAM enzyme
MKISDIKVVEARTLPSAESIHEIYNTPERDVLVLNYTLACPLSCDFCCYGCHPKRKEKMDLEAAKDLVSQAAQMDNFSSVGLTGGGGFHV